MFKSRKAKHAQIGLYIEVGSASSAYIVHAVVLPLHYIMTYRPT